MKILINSEVGYILKALLIIAAVYMIKLIYGELDVQYIALCSTILLLLVTLYFSRNVFLFSKKG